MYECPNCAGNLKFHIGKQQLHCSHCNTTMDPYAFVKEKDAEESELYEVTIFTCPQCGGEIMADDNTISTFCSFCGASTILDSRISKQKRPKYIIPFKKTEEESKAAYTKIVKGAFFAPKQLKDANAIEKFRGIYMPYWMYSFENKGSIQFIGSHTHTSNDTVQVDIKDLQCNVNAEYSGISFDASSTFSDHLSNAIAPFDIMEKKDFTPSFLSGFYADTSDVEADHYYELARNIIVEDEYEKIIADSSYSGYELENNRNKRSLMSALRPQKVEEELVLFPVWFLAYRKEDRVAYGVVNGQTGKVAVDLPIDMRRFFIGSLLLSIPFSLFLNLFCQLPAVPLLVFSAFLAAICAVFAHSQTTHIMLRESYDDTRIEEVEIDRAEKRKRIMGDLLTAAVLGCVYFSSIFLTLFMQVPAAGMVILGVIGMIYLFYLGFDVYKKRLVKDARNTDIVKYEEQWQKKLYTMIKPMLAIFIASFVLLLHPPMDIFYQIGAILCMGTTVAVIVDIIKGHNILTTRPLSQLDKRGGDL